MTSNNKTQNPSSTKRAVLSILAATFVCGLSVPVFAHSGDEGRAQGRAEGQASGLSLTAPRMHVAADRGLTPMVPPLRLAEVEVVNSNPAPAAPAAAPVAAAPVVAQEPVVAPRHEVVHHHEGSYMGTIALNALFGALAGGLVGGAIYYLSDNQTHAQRIAYWAAGGVLVGAGVGVVQIMADSRTESVAMSKLPHDPAPTYRLALLTTRF